jgi:hypothetical protein
MPESGKDILTPCSELWFPILWIAGFRDAGMRFDYFKVARIDKKAECPPPKPSDQQMIEIHSFPQGCNRCAKENSD